MTAPPLTKLDIDLETIRRAGVKVEELDAKIASMDGPRCREDVNYFIENYVHIHDEQAGGWVLFGLWQAQRALAVLWNTCRQLIGLKARQVGMTWLALAWLLHLVLSRPNSTVLLFSRTEDEAKELLRRMRGMHDLLPGWLQRCQKDDGHLTEWRLSNGSVVKAFPTGRGDSYTATAVLLDEFDVLTVREQEDQLRSVKPTTDAGGKLVVISRSDKTKPDSMFKKLYRAARVNGEEIGWTPFFLPWYARPSRDEAWYRRICADCQARTGSLDEVAEQYPATEEEALQERQLDKRLPAVWLDQCYEDQLPLAGAANHLADLLLPDGAAGLWDTQGLAIYRVPEQGRDYVIGADSAEGLPNSDDSAAEVLDAETLEQVASFAGKYSPDAHGQLVAHLSRWYNLAGVMVERNNHGHAVLLWLDANAPDVKLLNGRDNKPGWQTNKVSKSLLYDDAAEVVREAACVIHNLETRLQLGSVEISTLAAPDARHDDRAVAFVLAIAGTLRVERSIYRDRGLLILDGSGDRRAEALCPVAQALMEPAAIGANLYGGMFDDDEE